MIPNLKAFLDMLAWAEGTSTIVGSDNGYDVLVSGTPLAPFDPSLLVDLGSGRHRFASYADHPNVQVQVNASLTSTAAGRYQLLHRWWLPYKALLNLSDYSPASQDAVAVQQIRERGALADINIGNIPSAIARCSNIWASLPGSTYGQPVRPIGALLRQYTGAGGALAAAVPGVRQ